MDPTSLLTGVGCIFLGSIYVLAGVGHFRNLPALTQALASRGVPFPREVLLAGAVLQIAAGALLFVGLLRALMASALIVFTLAAGILLLNFWDKQGEARRTAIGQWRTNLALIGGLLVAATSA